MKKITVLEAETNQNVLTEAVSTAFSKDLDDLVNKYADSMMDELQDQLKAKIKEALKKKAGKL